MTTDLVGHGGEPPERVGERGAELGVHEQLHGVHQRRRHHDVGERDLQGGGAEQEAKEEFRKMDSQREFREYNKLIETRLILSERPR